MNNPFSKNRFPNKNDTIVACGTDHFKIAALYFDKIYVGTFFENSQQINIPQEITVGIRDVDINWHQRSIEYLQNMKIPMMQQRVPLIDSDFSDEIEDHSGSKFAYSTVFQVEQDYLDYEIVLSNQALCDLAFEKNISITPYNDIEGKSPKLGLLGISNTLISSRLESEIGFNVDSLPWEQILQFREDYDSISRFRRLRNWLNELVDTRGALEAEQILGESLYEYRIALKKHGIENLKGALNQILDVRNLALPFISAGTFLKGEFVLSILSGALGVAKISLDIAGSVYDSKIRKHDLKKMEVAIISDSNTKL